MDSAKAITDLGVQTKLNEAGNDENLSPPAFLKPVATTVEQFSFKVDHGSGGPW